VQVGADNATPAPLSDTTPLDLETVERLYGWGAARLKHWRRRKKGPPFIRVSPRVFVYRRCDIEKWLLARREVPGKPAAPDRRTTLVIGQGTGTT
jgi:hypothetical protein